MFRKDIGYFLPRKPRLTRAESLVSLSGTGPISSRFYLAPSLDTRLAAESLGVRDVGQVVPR